MRLIIINLYLFIGYFGLHPIWAQEREDNLTLEKCIEIALQNQPAVKQAQLDIEIGEREIASSLSGWFPQISATGNLQHYLQIPVINIGGNNIRQGLTNNSAISFQADQTLLNAGLIQASKAANYTRKLIAQNAANTQISTIAEVSKAYYDVLTSYQQINIIDENIQRNEIQFKNAQAQYDAGIVDKTDAKRAQISLANLTADKKSAQNLIKYKIAFLKQLMGLKDSSQLKIQQIDVQEIENKILLDTLQKADFNQRIEYQILKTQRDLQSINTAYNKWTFLPAISAFVNYNLNYRSNSFSELYKNNFPNSLVGITLSLPIFQGTKRNQELKKSILMERRLDLDLENLENNINTQYSQALAAYHSNLNYWKTAKSNVALSTEVYTILKLQYTEGIKTYLDLMTAATDLRTTQINYLNALYDVLASKIDVDIALGKINPTHTNE